MFITIVLCTLNEITTFDELKFTATFGATIINEQQYTLNQGYSMNVSSGQVSGNQYAISVHPHYILSSPHPVHPVVYVVQGDYGEGQSSIPPIVPGANTTLITIYGPTPNNAIFGTSIAAIQQFTNGSYYFVVGYHTNSVLNADQIFVFRGTFPSSPKVIDPPGIM